VAGAFNHGLASVLPRDLGEFAEGFEFAELGVVVGIGEASGAQSVAELEGDVVFL
jgi:hypothetical protein